MQDPVKKITKPERNGGIAQMAGSNPGTVKVKNNKTSWAW
jgi:hypothetical protein